MTFSQLKGLVAYYPYVMGALTLVFCYKGLIEFPLLLSCNRSFCCAAVKGECDASYPLVSITILIKLKAFVSFVFVEKEE